MRSASRRPPSALALGPAFGVQCGCVKDHQHLAPDVRSGLRGHRGRHGLPLWFVQRELEASQQVPAVTSPNDRPGVALIGCGGMGVGDANSASRFGDIVAVCDVDESHAAAAAKKFTKDEKVPAQFTDFRQVLERKDVNIIVQATPDHWHTIINLAAASAKEGHLRREAADADHRRRQADGQGGASAGRRPADRHAAAQPQALPPGVRAGAERPHRQADAGVRVRSRRPARGAVHARAGARRVSLGSLARTGAAGGLPQGALPLRTSAGGGTTPAGPVTDWGAHHNDIARWAIGLDGPMAIQASAPVAPIPGGFTTPPQFAATLMWAQRRQAGGQDDARRQPVRRHHQARRPAQRRAGSRARPVGSG